MKYLIVIFLFTFSTANAVTIFEFPKKEMTDNDISLLITRKAFVYNVDAKILHKVIQCESNYDTNAENINKWEESHGMVQINIRAHKEITKEQATDPEFAVDYLAKNIKEGRGKMWTCYNLHYKS